MLDPDRAVPGSTRFDQETSKISIGDKHRRLLLWLAPKGLNLCIIEDITLEQRIHKQMKSRLNNILDYI